jgi:mannose-1-phosphate guanylyltransferase/phosphomannomutase
VVDYAHAPAADVLPELLDGLGIDVVPLNARVDTNKLSQDKDELRAGRAQLARIVRALDNVSMGIRVDVGGERLFVADEKGATVSDEVMAVAMAALVLRQRPGSTIVVTLDQPNVYEELAERYGGQIRRCPVDANALMRAAVQDGVALAADGSGNFVFPGLHPVIDGLYAVGKLLELLACERTPLSQVIADLPPFYVASGHVEGVWETKGRVMRCLINQFAKMRHETLDGIKVHVGEGEWVLIRPDNDTSLFHLTAEARSLPHAQELIADYGGLVRTYVHEPCLSNGAAGDETQPQS